MTNLAQQHEPAVIPVVLVVGAQLLPVYRTMLSSEKGFALVPATDVTSAVEKINEAPVPVLLITGESVCGDALVGLNPETRPEIIVLPENLTSEVWAAELLSGASEVLPSDTPPEHLLSVLHRAAQRWHRRRVQRAVQGCNPMRDLVLLSHGYVA